MRSNGDRRGYRIVGGTSSFPEFEEARVGRRILIDDGNRSISGIGQIFRKVKKESLYAFAKEVRRRARIRLSVNRVNPPGYGNNRYGTTLSQAIEFDVDDDAVAFTVGRGLPYASLEDMAKGRSIQIQGSPVLRFHWYRMQKPMRLYRPVKVVRKGKGFFTGALTGSVDDFQKIIDRHVAKEARKQG